MTLHRFSAVPAKAANLHLTRKKTSDKLRLRAIQEKKKSLAHTLEKCQGHERQSQGTVPYQKKLKRFN